MMHKLLESASSLPPRIAAGPITGLSLLNAVAFIGVRLDATFRRLWFDSTAVGMRDEVKPR